MKAICIVGSPHERGSTAFLVSRVMEGMCAAGVEATMHILGSMHIGYCDGCRTCETSRRCVLRDDMDVVLAGIMEADIVLLASPSYWGDVTGQMKVFIDRSLPLCNAVTGESPVPAGKAGVAVATRAGRSRGETQHILDTFEHYLGHLGISMVAGLTAEGVGCLADIEHDQAKINEARDLGLALGKGVSHSP
jgi:multimeric flavodoxin WrbA